MPDENTTTETVIDAPQDVNGAQQATEAPQNGTATPQSETPDAAQLRAELESAQARIHELNKENEKRRLAEKKAAEEKLAEEGKLQELAEQREQERDAAIAERDAMKRLLTVERLSVAHGLPVELRDRVQGTTEEEIEADIKKLASLIPARPQAPQAPDMTAQSRGAAAPGVLDAAREAEVRRKFRLGSPVGVRQ